MDPTGVKSPHDPTPPSKRQKTTATYARKRAVTACQICRARKTKCDNQRPACGFCQQSGSQCIYASSSNDYTSSVQLRCLRMAIPCWLMLIRYDPAILALLDRVNHVVSLLEGRPFRGAEHQSNEADIMITQEPLPAGLRSTIQTSGNSTLPFASASGGQGGYVSAAKESPKPSDLPEYPSIYWNCESVMRWPIFRETLPAFLSLVNQNPDDKTSNLCSPPGSLASRQSWSSTLTRGIQESDFVPLSKKFLAYVHIKNPILDVAQFKLDVKAIAENGAQWDGPSCLVVPKSLCLQVVLSSPT